MLDMELDELKKKRATSNQQQKKNKLFEFVRTSYIGLRRKQNQDYDDDLHDDVRALMSVCLDNSSSWFTTKQYNQLKKMAQKQGWI